MTAIRRGARVGLGYLTAVFFLGVIVQFFLVGYGLFAMKHGATIDNAHSLNAHRDFGWALGEIGGALILILTLVSWPRPKILGLYVLLVVLAFPVQGVLASSGVHHKWVGMLHPVNALILFGLSGFLAHRSFASARTQSAEPAAA